MWAFIHDYNTVLINDINIANFLKISLQTRGWASGTGSKGSTGATEDLGRGGGWEVAYRLAAAAGEQCRSGEHGTGEGWGAVSSRGRSHWRRSGRRTGQAQGTGCHHWSGKIFCILTASLNFILFTVEPHFSYLCNTAASPVWSPWGSPRLFP